MHHSDATHILSQIMDVGLFERLVTAVSCQAGVPIFCTKCIKSLLHQHVTCSRAALRALAIKQTRWVAHTLLRLVVQRRDLCRQPANHAYLRKQNN